MGQKNSKSETLNLNEIAQLETEDVFKKKKKHLEPDTIGAQLSTKAHCVAMFDQDIIFRRHAEEKLDPKDQPTSVETKNQDHPGFIHHPSGLVIKKKHPGQCNYYKTR